MNLGHAPIQHEAATEDEMNLQPSATLKNKGQKSQGKEDDMGQVSC